MRKNRVKRGILSLVEKKVTSMNVLRVMTRNQILMNPVWPGMEILITNYSDYPLICSELGVTYTSTYCIPLAAGT